MSQIQSMPPKLRRTCTFGVAGNYREADYKEWREYTPDHRQPFDRRNIFRLHDNLLQRGVNSFSRAGVKAMIEGQELTMIEGSLLTRYLSNSLDFINENYS